MSVCTSWERSAMTQAKKLSRLPCPNLPLEPIAQAVLGRHYELSVVICGNELSRRLNRTYRAKDKPTNVLAFPLSATAGEVFLNWPLIRRQARHFDRTPAKHLLALFIHGLLHLKGMDHGSKMESKEKKFLAHWSNEKYCHRTRHRHGRYPDRRC